MIYTVTFNPALDYVVRLSQLVPGAVNRTEAESLQCGGKGINVSTVLKALGVPSVALGFAAGFTGRALVDSLTEQGIANEFVTLPAGLSRINVKLKTGQETEINGRGPDIDPESLEVLCRRLDRLTGEDMLVLAGSIPASLPSDIYERILERVKPTGCAAVVDATGDLLARVLPYRPFLIKPNHLELGELCGVTLSPQDTSAVTAAARTLQERGARNVLVSMAGDGALLVTEDGQILRQAAAKGKVLNSVGAGDSMVAGFLAGWQSTGDYTHALRLGTAAGGATAFSVALATRQEIDRVLETLQ